MVEHKVASSDSLHKNISDMKDTIYAEINTLESVIYRKRSENLMESDNDNYGIYSVCR